MSQQPAFEIYRTNRRRLGLRTKQVEWSWRLRAANGKIIASPHEAFTRQSDAVRSVDLVKSIAPGALIKYYD